MNGGQTCVRPDFVMVHEAVADAFFAAVRRCVHDFYGDAQKSEWFGRCINDAAFDRLAALISGASEHVVIGGQVDKADRCAAPTCACACTCYIIYVCACCVSVQCVCVCCVGCVGVRGRGAGESERARQRERCGWVSGWV